jgi:hypothetical protein
VLTQTRLDEIVPIHNAVMEKRTFIEWDKDDIETLRMMKVDVLALGMLTCIRKSFDLMRAHGLGNVDLASVPRRILQLTRCCKGRQHRHLSGREPRPDGHAAPDETGRTL